MRRLIAALTAIVTVIMLSCTAAHAASDKLSIDYVPRTPSGTIFYLDISYDGSLSAAMLELSYDSSLVEYRSIEAIAMTSTVKAKSDGGKVTIVFGDSASVSGRLCRLTFKALGSGDAAFTLRMTEGVDGELRQIAPPTDAELTVSFASASFGESSGGRSGSSYRGTKSGKSASASDDAATYDETIMWVRDLSPNNIPRYVAIGAGIGAVMVLLVVLGVLIGRRMGKKKQASSADDTENASDDQDDNSDIE